MTTPLEIIGGGPFTVYVAPVSEARPEIDDSEGTLTGGNWDLLGVTGSNNYDESGIAVAHPQTMEYQRVLGRTAPVKAFRTQEDLSIELTLVDLSAATYALILNDKSVTTVAAASGVPGEKYFVPYRGLTVAEFAVLLRAPSPEMATGNMQWWIPRMVIEGEPKPTFVKGAGASLVVMFKALWDGSQSAGSEFGRISVQTAAAQ